MRAGLALALALFAFTTACGDKATTPCQKYAQLEWECGGYPASEKQITLQMAEAMCEGALAEKEASMMADMFKAELECAKTSADCAAYKACNDKRDAADAPSP